MHDPHGSSDPPHRTRPLTWAVVVCVVVYNAYVLIRSVHSELWGWMIPILVVWFSIPVAALYAFKRLHMFMTGDRDRQHPAGDQLLRALLIGGFIHLVGVAIRYEPPEADEEPVRKATPTYQVPTKAPQGSTASLAEYVERCSLTGGDQGLVLQTSDGGLHLMDLRSGALVSPPPDPSVSFEALTASNAWSASQVRHLHEENRVIHTREPEHQMDLDPLGLQYLGPAASSDHFIAFHSSTREFQRLDVTTGQAVWRLPFDRMLQVLPPDGKLRLLNATQTWNLLTLKRDSNDRDLRYLLLVDDPELLISAGVDASEAKKPHWALLESVIPAGWQGPSRIRELVQIPGTPNFLLSAEGGQGRVDYVRFRLQQRGNGLDFSQETISPQGDLLIRRAYDGPDPGLDFSGREVALEPSGKGPWRALDPKRHPPPISGFSVPLDGDVLLPSPLEGRLELLRAGQGYLPWVAQFPGRSFSRDRHCAVQSADGRLVAIALGSQLRVLFKAGQGGVDEIRQWRIELPINARAAIDGASRR